MSTELLFALIVGATALERIYELIVTKRNATWSFQHGGKEFGQKHYPFMVVLHTGFLVACVAEVYLFDRPFYPAMGVFFVIGTLLCQVLRWWCITTLGTRWNSRVIIVPGLQRVTDGPYRWFPHPNYVAVVAEGMLLPMIHSAYVTAIVFTLLNSALLGVRIAVENKALCEMENSTPI